MTSSARRWINIGLEYRDWGLSIIPIGFEKRPLFSWKEYQGRKAGLEELEKWCQMPDFQGFGVVTGSISGLFVLDIDNGADVGGLILPSTPAARTGSGGKHYYFQYPKDISVKNQTGILPHVDIRGNGGYAVLPPAKHPSGINYSWITDLSTPMAEMPQWLRNQLTKHPTVQNFNPQLLRGVSEGQRNDSTARLAGKLLRHLPPHEWETTAWPLIESWNQRNNPPLNQMELRGTYDSIARRESNRKLNGHAPSYNSFPPEETPGLTLAELNFEPKLQSWEEFIREKTDDSGQWLIKDILRPGWLAVLGGHGKHGKSTLALHLLNCFRTGGNFINACTPTSVVYVNYEMGSEDVREMLQIMTAFSSTEGESAKIISQPPLTPAGRGLEWLEHMLKEQPKPGVCVLDSFRAAFMLVGDTENQAGAVGGILRRLQGFARKTNWAIILIHHFRKSGTGDPLDLAGSGEWVAAPDVILTWNCPSWKEPGTLTISGRVPSQEPLSVKISREKLEFFGTVVEQAAESERQRVLDVLPYEEEITSKEIAEQVKLPDPTVRRHLTKLLHEGSVSRTGEGKKGNPHKWRRVKDATPEQQVPDRVNETKQDNDLSQRSPQDKHLVRVEDLPSHLQYYIQQDVIERYEQQLVLSDERTLLTYSPVPLAISQSPKQGGMEQIGREEIQTGFAKEEPT